jgi:DNA-binding HxlR family transcriptional regulator
LSTSDTLDSMRSYGDGCSSAHALDLVGDRWALLIVRDLLLGPKRFSDLRAGLPNGSANVLTQRLRELEAAGVVQRRRLPPPASTNVYELTPWGAELEPVVLLLQRWGAGSPAFSPDVPVGCDAAMLALKNGFLGDDGGGDVRVEVRFPAGTFAVDIADGSIAIARGPAPGPVDLAIETDPTTLEHLAFTGLTVAGARRMGMLVVVGDVAAAQAFFDRFGGPTA